MNLTRDEKTGNIIGTEKRFEAYYMDLCAPSNGPIGVFDGEEGLNQCGVWLDNVHDVHESWSPIGEYKNSIWIELTEDGANALLKYNEEELTK